MRQQPDRSYQYWRQPNDERLANPGPRAIPCAQPSSFAGACTGSGSRPGTGATTVGSCGDADTVCGARRNRALVRRPRILFTGLRGASLYGPHRDRPNDDSDRASRRSQPGCANLRDDFFGGRFGLDLQRNCRTGFRQLDETGIELSRHQCGWEAASHPHRDPYCCGAGFAKTVSATGTLIFTSVNFSVATAFQVECLMVNGSFTPLTSR